MSKKTNLKMCLIPVFLLGMLSTVPVQAIVYVDDNAPAPGNGLTWSTAYPALQDALYDPVLGPNDQIRVAQGTYKPDQASLWYSPMSGDRAESFQLVNGVSLKGGYNGAYSGPGDPDARNIYTYQTILSGDINTPSNTDNSYHVVTGSWTDQSAIIDGFTITAGYANGPPMDNWGGGMYNFSGSPTVSNCTFSSNTAEGDGGGMANDTSSDPTVTNCTFTGNSATGLEGNGGGMYNNDSDPILVNCAFVSNSASYSGGGMGNGLSSPTLTGCIFTDNSATVYGGGMSNVYNCYPKLTDCNVSGNEAQYGGG
ncbi:MAG: right-handed parallel beta-helix repeat-containing protein, partial [Planctomycetota bacterium]